MGYLDGSTITVDAILTQEGRKKLARGAGLGISKFSLSDDGIDYKLWNTGHPSGSAYYGEAINNLPNLEAITDGHIGMRYNLMTMDRDRVFLPYLQIEPNEITIDEQNDDGAKYVHVHTLNYTKEKVYWKIFDSSAIIVNVATKDVSGTTHKFRPEQDIPSTVVAGPSTALKIMAQPIKDKTITGTIHLYGAESGATGYLKYTLKPNIRKLR